MNKFETTLKKYLDIFTGQEMYFTNDTSNLELFSKTHGNTDIEDIKTKVSALNDTDVRSASLEQDMIDHILQLNIDDRLKKNDMTVVVEIANLTVRGTTYRFLHFASVYCNFHKPDIFPIYSEQYLEFYKKYIVEHKLPLDPQKLDTYEVFSAALNDLVQRLNLKGKMDYLHLRKFAWLYADKVIQESKT